ncbi:MAG TPA: DNA adenine methylase [Ignavibacteria bacterium]|nr:DNA adenine methylase [Ignavibacteria bacterium]
MIKSPLRYPGGKSKAIKTMLPLIPDFDEYREPMLGGGSLFLTLKQLFPQKKYWVNDIYYQLFKFWEMSQINLDNLECEINNLRNKFNSGKELHKYLIENIDKFNDIQTASAFFVLNRITFSGTSESGGYSQQAFEKRFTESSVERVKQLNGLLSNTLITNFDYLKVINTPGKNVFIYLDPPYHSATKSALYGKNGNLHKDFDHEKFAQSMKSCEHKWLITYDDSEYIRGLFSFAKIYSWNLTYGMRNVRNGSDKKGKELFISNYLYSMPELNEQFLLFDKKKKKLSY